MQVEMFWRYFNNMTKPTQVRVNANYHLFKDSIKPMWEDPANAKGGKWVITMKHDRNNMDFLDVLWQNLVILTTTVTKL